MRHYAIKFGTRGCEVELNWYGILQRYQIWSFKFRWQNCSKLFVLLQTVFLDTLCHWTCSNFLLECLLIRGLKWRVHTTYAVSVSNNFNDIRCFVLSHILKPLERRLLGFILLCRLFLLQLRKGMEIAGIKRTTGVVLRSHCQCEYRKLCRRRWKYCVIQQRYAVQTNATKRS